MRVVSPALLSPRTSVAPNDECRCVEWLLKWVFLKQATQAPKAVSSPSPVDDDEEVKQGATTMVLVVRGADLSLLPSNL